jgi:hypothetical protein
MSSAKRPGPIDILALFESAKLPTQSGVPFHIG